MKHRILPCILAVALWPLHIMSLTQESYCTYQQPCAIDNTEQLVLEAFPLIMHQLFAIMKNPRDGGNAIAVLPQTIATIIRLTIDLVNNRSGTMTQEQRKDLLVKMERALNNAVLTIKTAHVSL